ncbi:MAG: DUF928 domain-containing protein [Richelia sp.]|nr:DUF928 domain-containing protein [Richelia sp.]
MPHSCNARKLLYEKTFKPIPRSGISSFKRPQDGTINTLAINQNYLWSVSIICNLQDNSPKSVITSYGWVRRVSLDQVTSDKIPTLSQSDRLSI